MNPIRNIANLLRVSYRWWIHLSPPAIFVTSFVALIGFGWLGLMALPGLYAGAPLGPLDALFTITSAVCVTGLIVVDTATYFTRAGQAWLLLFIQLGGIGLISLTTLIIGALGRRLSLRTEMLTVPSVDLARRRTVVALTWAVLKFTFAIELAGAVVLYVQWIGDYGPALAAWHAVFHSVSAFCNAGFSTFSESLMGQAQRPLILLPLTALVVVGGFGYLAFEETLRWMRSPRVHRLHRALRLSSHTTAALSVTALLLVAGTALFAAFEWSRALAPMGLGSKLVNAWVMSVMPRTAGFNAVDYSQLTNASIHLTALLMFVGGSPGSTAGGIKTTSLAVLAALAWSRVRGRRFVTLHGRSIPDLTVERTVSLTLMAVMLLIVCVFVLSFSEAHGAGLAQERQSFLPQLFEAISALGTVGLSMNLTPSLSAIGKWLIIVLMFIGRVGPLAFFAAVALKGARFPRDFRPAREDVIVG